MSDTTRTEGRFRQGYLQGVRSTIEVLGTHLPEEQQRVLAKWIDGPLTAWSRADDEAPAPMAPLLDGA